MHRGLSSFKHAPGASQPESGFCCIRLGEFLEGSLFYWSIESGYQFYKSLGRQHLFNRFLAAEKLAGVA